MYLQELALGGCKIGAVRYSAVRCGAVRCQVTSLSKKGTLGGNLVGAVNREALAIHTKRQVDTIDTNMHLPVLPIVHQLATLRSPLHASYF